MEGAHPSFQSFSRDKGRYSVKVESIFSNLLKTVIFQT